MTYKKLDNCWNGIGVYNLNGNNEMFRENYNPVTLPFPEYQDYLATGMNAIDASGGVSISGISPGGVVQGQIRQNPMTASAPISGGVPRNSPGLGWIN
jgi:hypothetical protein